MRQTSRADSGQLPPNTVLTSARYTWYIAFDKRVGAEIQRQRGKECTQAGRVYLVHLARSLVLSLSLCSVFSHQTTNLNSKKTNCAAFWGLRQSVLGPADRIPRARVVPLFCLRCQLATAVQLEPPWSLEATFGLCFSPPFLPRTPNVFPRRTPGTAKTATAAGFSSINFIRRLLLWAEWQQLWRKGGCGVAGCERGGFRVGGAVENRRSWRRRRRRRVGWRNKQQTSRRSGRRSERGWVVRRGGGRGLPQGLLGEQSCDAFFFSRPQLAPVLLSVPRREPAYLTCVTGALSPSYVPVGLLKKPVACDL